MDKIMLHTSRGIYIVKSLSCNIFYDFIICLYFISDFKHFILLCFHIVLMYTFYHITHQYARKAKENTRKITLSSVPLIPSEIVRIPSKLHTKNQSSIPIPALVMPSTY